VHSGSSGLLGRSLRDLSREQSLLMPRPGYREAGKRPEASPALHLAESGAPGGIPATGRGQTLAPIALRPVPSVLFSALASPLASTPWPEGSAGFPGA
jgi:hypothetical protein